MGLGSRHESDYHSSSPGSCAYQAAIETYSTKRCTDKICEAHWHAHLHMYLYRFGARSFYASEPPYLYAVYIQVFVEYTYEHSATISIPAQRVRCLPTLS